MIFHDYFKNFFLAWQSFFKRKIARNNNICNSGAVLTPELLFEHQESAVVWNTCHSSNLHFHSLLRLKNHHSLALRCSEGTGWCSGLDRQRDRCTHSDLHEPQKYKCTRQMAVDETSQILCRWISLRSNREPSIVWLLWDMPAYPTGSPGTLCPRTVPASPGNGNGTEPNS